VDFYSGSSQKILRFLLHFPNKKGMDFYLDRVFLGPRGGLLFGHGTNKENWIFKRGVTTKLLYFAYIAIVCHFSGTERKNAFQIIINGKKGPASIGAVDVVHQPANGRCIPSAAEAGRTRERGRRNGIHTNINTQETTHRIITVRFARLYIFIPFIQYPVSFN